MDKNIGWIGIGHMGLPMAKNLYNANFPIKVWNRTLHKAKQSGLPYTKTLEGLVLESDVIITMLFDAKSVEEVYQHITTLDIKGKVFIDMTTSTPETQKHIAENLIKKGAEFLEAPVIGSVIPAEKGLLTIVVSGDKNIYKENISIFNVLGKEIIFLGDYGKATIMKLINNTILGSFLNVLCEAYAMVKKSDIDPVLALKVLENGAGKSMILDAKKEKLLNEDYSTHFSVKLIHKDLNYALELAQKLNTPAPFSALSRELYNSAIAHKLEDSDFSAVWEIFKKMSGIN